MPKNNRRQTSLSRAAAKIQAVALRRRAAEEGRAITHRQALEEVARRAGFRSLRSMVSARKKAEGGMEAEAPSEPGRVVVGVDRTGSIPTETLESFAAEIQSVFDGPEAETAPKIQVDVLDVPHSDVRVHPKRPGALLLMHPSPMLWSPKIHARTLSMPLGKSKAISDFAYDFLVEAFGQERADAHMAEHGLTRKKG